MAELKTKLNDKSVEAFLESIEDEKKRQDAFALLRLMQEATGETPAMWGESIIGYGLYHYKSDSGREGDWMLYGFSPRKEHLVLYIPGGFDTYETLVENLGKCKRGKGCIYIKRLTDIDPAALQELVKQAAENKVKSST